MKQEYLREAKRVASNGQRHPFFWHAAFLLEGNRVLAVARNGSGLHAEERLLRKIPKGTNWRKVRVLVIRVNRLGMLRSSKPCSSCATLLQHKGIRVIEHS